MTPVLAVLTCIAVVGGGCLAARIGTRFVGRIFERMFDRTGFGAGIARGDIGTVFGRSALDRLISRAVVWTVLLFAARRAVGTFGRTRIFSLLDAAVTTLPVVGLALLLLVLAAAIGRVIRELIDPAFGALSPGKTVDDGLGIVVLVVAFVVARQRLEGAPVLVIGLVYGALAIVVHAAIVAATTTRSSRNHWSAGRRPPPVRDDPRGRAACLLERWDPPPSASGVLAPRPIAGSGVTGTIRHADRRGRQATPKLSTGRGLGAVPAPSARAHRRFVDPERRRSCRHAGSRDLTCQTSERMADPRRLGAPVHQFTFDHRGPPR